MTITSNGALAATGGPGPGAHQITEALLKLVTKVPASGEPESATPAVRGKALARNAAKASAAISGTAALAPGPLGLLTLLPDMIGVWKVQEQMVADIAAAYGKSATLSKEQMVFCLFKHTSSQLLRDVIVRSGERYLVRPLSIKMMQGLVAQIGIQLGQRTVGKTVARFAPVVGALGVAGYAYYDTLQVAKTAIRLFSSDVVSSEQHEARFSAGTTPG